MDGKTDQQDKVLDERRPTVFNYFCTSFNNGPVVNKLIGEMMAAVATRKRLDYQQ